MTGAAWERHVRCTLGLDGTDDQVLKPVIECDGVLAVYFGGLDGYALRQRGSVQDRQSDLLSVGEPAWILVSQGSLSHRLQPILERRLPESHSRHSGTLPESGS